MRSTVLVERFAPVLERVVGPGFQDGGAEASRVDLLGGREGAALGEAREAELEVLALGAQGGVDGAGVVLGEDVGGDLEADLADALVELGDLFGEAGALCC